MPSKKKRPPPLDLSEKQDDLKRMVTVSAKKPPQDDQPKTHKKRKMEPYDPQVASILHQECEENRKKPSKRRRELVDDEELNVMADQLDQTIQQMTPMNSPVKAVLEKTTLLEEGEVPPMVCPFHVELLVNIPNKKGYDLMKCPDQPCLISIFDENNKQAYMEGAYNKVHKDIQDVWHKLLCDCGTLPSLLQSRSEKNPGRMYLACRNHQCKYFQWTDEPLADPEDVMTCPYHLKKMEERTSQNGWQYL